MKTKIAMVTDVGSCRNNNEDNYVVMDKMNHQAKIHENFTMKLDSDLQFFGVFDGMGGHSMGEVASGIAASVFSEQVRDYIIRFGKIDLALEHLTQTMNDQVYTKCIELKSNLGTTSTLLVMKGRKAFLCHLGDSRCYQIHKEMINLISEDHIDRYHKENNIKGKLTQYLGISREELILEPTMKIIEIAKSDVFILCSDGITDLLSDSDLLKLYQATPEINEFAMHVYDKYIQLGSKDNMTFLVIQIG